MFDTRRVCGHADDADALYCGAEPSFRYSGDQGVEWRCFDHRPALGVDAEYLDSLAVWAALALAVGAFAGTEA